MALTSPNRFSLLEFYFSDWAYFNVKSILLLQGGIDKYKCKEVNINLMAKKKYDEEVKQYTPTQLRKAKAAAKNHYSINQGEVSVKVLSRVAKVPQGYIREWMKDENWDEGLKEEPEDVVNLSETTKEVLTTGAEQYNLNEQEELFCYHYMKTFNATTSAIKAGYSPSYAHNKAYLLLRKDKVRDFINHVKQQRNQELFLDPMRVIQEYMKIAFADITDFVKFGPAGVQARSSSTVDGQMIVKIKEGRDGISIELADKMKALEKLEQYMGVMPDDWRQLIEEKKLHIAQQKLELDKERIENGGDIPIEIMITRKGVD